MINNLPSELLSRIFELGSASDIDAGAGKGSVDDDSEETHGPAEGDCDVSSAWVPFPILVSRVCHHWRIVALSTPSLWTTIRVDRGTSPPYKRISTPLERSKTLPIDIHCDLAHCYGHEHLDNVRHLFSLLIPHVRRWRTMKLSVSNYHHIHTFFGAISHPSVAGAPLLKTLDLSYFNLDIYEDPSIRISQNPDLFWGSAPLLTSLVLRGVHVDWNMPWIAFASNLRQLELVAHKETLRPSWAQFVSILRSASALEKLVLYRSGPSGDPAGWFIEPTHGSPADINAPIQLVHVSHLGLASHSEAYVIGLLRKFYLPGIKHLGLEFHTGDYSALIRELAGPATSPSQTQGLPPSLLSRLESLTICGLPCMTSSIRTLYGELRNLTTLNLPLKWGPPKLFLEILCSPCTFLGSNAWLPRLVTLGISIASSDDVRKLVEQRREAGVPLRYVKVIKLYNVKAEDVAWLKKNLKTFRFD